MNTNTQTPNTEVVIIDAERLDRRLTRIEQHLGLPPLPMPADDDEEA